MKHHRRLITALALCGVIVGFAEARRILWQPAEKPPVSLRLALALAEAELEKQGTHFYCVGASLAKTFSDADWELQFSSAGGKRVWVSVASSREVKMSARGFEH